MTLHASRTLLAKELRDLRPFLLVQLGLITVNTLSRYPFRGETPLAHTLDQGLGWATVFVPLALMTGVTLATREADDRTLGFLDGLPVTRTAVFAAKVLAAWCIVTVGPALDVAVDLVFHLFLADHLQRDPRLALVLGALGLRLIGVYTCVLLGAALGLLRSLTWPAIALLWSGVTALAQRSPRAAALTPQSWVDVRMVGDHLDLQWDALGAQAAIGGASALAAYAAFRLSGRLRLPEPGGVARAGLALTGVLAVSTALALLAFVDLRDTQRRIKMPGTEDITLAIAPASSATTAHYRFSYNADNAGRVSELAHAADAIAEQVAQLLGAEPGAPIEVDTSGSMDNTAGTAFDGSVRLDLSGRPQATLAHETAHVLSARRVGNEGRTRWQDAIVLNEGLANWVEEQVRPAPAALKARLDMLAVLQTRGELDLQAIGDWWTFEKDHDPEVKYAIGEQLIAALVRVGGQDAPGRVLVAFGDPSLPADLRGLGAWQAAFQLAGVDLPAVMADAAAQIDADVQALGPWIPALPRPRFTLVTDGEQVGLRADLDAPLQDGWRVMARFTPHLGAPIGQERTRRVSPAEPHWIDDDDVEGGQVCAQIGLRPGGEITIYEPWRCVPVSTAEALP